jgi:hypothetical protein
MADNYDVENQGRPESAPAATTCLMEKPDIDKKVKVSWSLLSTLLASLIG